MCVLVGGQPVLLFAQYFLSLKETMCEAEHLRGICAARRARSLRAGRV